MMDRVATMPANERAELIRFTIGLWLPSRSHKGSSLTSSYLAARPSPPSLITEGNGSSYPKRPPSWLALSGSPCTSKAKPARTPERAASMRSTSVM